MRQSGAIFEWSGFEFYQLSCWILLVKPSGSNILHDTIQPKQGRQADSTNEQSIYSMLSMITAKAMPALMIMTTKLLLIKG